MHNRTQQTRAGFGNRSTVVFSTFEKAVMHMASPQHEENRDEQAPINNIARNLVVCCDGTSNEVGKQLSNVLKLYRIAEKSNRQVVFYQPGIGTVSMPDSWGKRRQRAHATFEMVTGKGLDRDVLAAYRFLAENYREGDRIFLFGYNCGYTCAVGCPMASPPTHSNSDTSSNNAMMRSSQRTPPSVL